MIGLWEANSVNMTLWPTGCSHSTLSVAIPIKPFITSDVLMVPSDSGQDRTPQSQASGHPQGISTIRGVLVLDSRLDLMALKAFSYIDSPMILWILCGCEHWLRAIPRSAVTSWSCVAVGVRCVQGDAPQSGTTANSHPETLHRKTWGNMGEEIHPQWVCISCNKIWDVWLEVKDQLLWLTRGFPAAFEGWAHGLGNNQQGMNR